MQNTVKDADIIIIGVPVEAFSNVIKKISNHLKRGCNCHRCRFCKKIVNNLSKISS